MRVASPVTSHLKHGSMQCPRCGITEARVVAKVNADVV